MKQNLTYLLVIFITLSICQSATAQLPDRQLTLPQSDLTGLALVKVIRNQAGMHFNYGESINAKLSAPIKETRHQISVKEALELIKASCGVSYEVNGEYITLPSTSGGHPATASKKNPGKIMGKVLDNDTGEPLSDVSIRIGNKGVITGMDGAFTITLQKGTYQAEISLVGYEKKIVSDIEVFDSQVLDLNMTLKRAKNTLEGVVIKSSAKKEGAAALYARQKNTAEISNGISAEQISATPDKNAGEVLKRISGVSTNDNRRVVVRGIAERYNVAMLDGVTLPSTDVQVRDFEFDIIPSNLIDNIIVSKSYTPDMSFGFGGGLVQINTLTIPTQNFMTINVGGKYNSNSTGKEFLGYQRGKYDYLGFDDGARKAPFSKDIFFFENDRYNPSNPYQDVTPPGSGLTPITPAMIAEQNKKIGGTERLGTRIYKARPSQNYQFSLGKNYNLGKSQLGFVTSVSYRNEQNIDEIGHFERGSWTKNSYNMYDPLTMAELKESTGKQYQFTTSWAALVNGGWQFRNHKITTRNFYSRVFQSQFTRFVGWGSDLGFGEDPAVQENDSPKFIDLLQNKLSGEHKFGHLTVEWNLARNKITNHEHDAVEAWTSPQKTSNSTVYTYSPNSVTDPGVGPFNRAQYNYDEDNLMADGALSYNIRLGKQNQRIKAGYQYLRRHGKYDWNILPIGSRNGSRYRGIPLQKWGEFFDFKDALNDIYYYPGAFSLNSYEGQNTNEAFFGMMDNRITSWLRLVYGLRIESYVYEETKDGTSSITGQIEEQAEAKRRYVDPNTGELVHKYLNASTEDKKWRYLPSVNATFTPLANLNIRASYAKTAVRPSLIENSGFSRFNPTLGRVQRNVGVISTIIDHYDAKIEWYPGAGEVLSAGYFYKYFKNPAEMYLDVTSSSQVVEAMTGNSDWAKVRGWEFDLRKSLGFLYPAFKPLRNLYFSGNLTFQNSDVQASTFRYASFGEGSYDKQELSYAYREKTLLKEKRPLYGQVPVLYNIGLLYNADRLTVNAAFNHMGYKTFTVGMLPDYVEYERPRNQMDAQIGYAFLKKKTLRLKLNMSNLLNNPFRFFVNNASTYKQKEGTENLYDLNEWSDRYEWKFGFSEKYEEGYYEKADDGVNKKRIGDTNTFSRKVGSSFSLSLSYSF